jgi:Holliday junction resolvase RusA-like endonuclease
VRILAIDPGNEKSAWVQYDITPCTKPRMTQRDKWKTRPETQRYWAFKDEVRLKNVIVPEYGYHVVFIIPMPKSWSKKKREEMNRQPHKQTPDKDNLEKALLDAIYDDDSTVWDGRVTKLWGESGMIIVSTET